MRVLLYIYIYVYIWGLLKLAYYYLGNSEKEEEMVHTDWYRTGSLYLMEVLGRKSGITHYRKYRHYFKHRI